MTGRQIIDMANSLADDNIDFDEVWGFVNSAISKINMEMPALFPAIENADIDEDYYVMRPKADAARETDPVKKAAIIKRNKHLSAANNMFIHQLVIPYTLYLIKVQDGSQYEWERTGAEFKKNMNMFITVWQDMVDPDWKTAAVDIDGNGKFNENGFSATVFAGDSYTGPAKTWGNDPGSGVYVEGTEANSLNPFGRGK